MCSELLFVILGISVLVGTGEAPDDQRVVETVVFSY